MRKPKPGAVAPNRIAVFDHQGNMRGHVGRTATEATVSRFTGHPGATLVRKNGGKLEWHGKPPAHNTAAPAAIGKREPADPAGCMGSAKKR